MNTGQKEHYQKGSQVSDSSGTSLWPLQRKFSWKKYILHPIIITWLLNDALFVCYKKNAL